MARIRPPKIKSYKVVYGKFKESVGFTEFGVCSSIIAELNDDQITIHDMAMSGMFYKNKDAEVAEAQICEGTGTVDYPLLVPIRVLAEKAKGLPAGMLLTSVSL
jgi:hypothetical protein